MNKKLFKLYFLLLISILSIEKTYALELSNPTTIGYIACGLFIIIGIIFIIVGKFSNTKKAYFEDEKKKNNNNQKTNNNIPIFNQDSIFKIIPTFSNKKFHEETYKDLNKYILDKNKEITNINIVKKAIIDFKDEPNKYIIKTEYLIDFNDKENKKIEKKYIITSENTKEIKTFAICPNCGGKIKEKDLLRCKYCKNILPPNTTNNNNNNNNWNITNIEEK